LRLLHFQPLQRKLLPIVQYVREYFKQKAVKKALKEKEEQQGLKVLTWLDQLGWASVIDAADSEEIKALEAKVGSLDLAISRDSHRVETIIDSLVDLPSPALKARLAATRVRCSALN
jgi:hypothetical protein